jgi:hypothetical protein
MNDVASRTIGMTFDFIRQVVVDANIAASLTDGAEIEFIEMDPQTLVKNNPRKKKVMRYRVRHVFELIRT